LQIPLFGRCECIVELPINAWPWVNFLCVEDINKTFTCIAEVVYAQNRDLLAYCSIKSCPMAITTQAAVKSAIYKLVVHTSYAYT
jgi:hypothetical protein